MYSSLRARYSLACTVVLAFALTGCTAGAAPIAEPSSSSTPIVKPVVTPPPASQFPLECEDLFPSDARRAASGGETIPDPEMTTNPFALAVARQNGSLHCGWESKGYELGVNINRNARLYVAETEPWFTGGDQEKNNLGADTSQFSCQDEEYMGTSSCAATATVGDYHLFGYSSEKAGGGAASLADRYRAAFTDVVARLKAAPVPAPWAAPAGSWPLLADCEGVESGGGVADALGNPALSVERSGGIEAPVLSLEYDAIGGSTVCWWSGVASGPADLVQHATLTVLAGGAWYWDAPAPESADTVKEIEIEGADDAAVRCDAGGCSLDARVGNNAFQVSSGYMATPLTEQQLVDAAHAVVTGILSTVD